MFCCPQCGSDCWGTSGDIGCCHASTRTGVGGCGFQWQRSRANDAALGIAAPPQVVETGQGAYVMREYPSQKLNDYLAGCRKCTGMAGCDCVQCTGIAATLGADVDPTAEAIRAGAVARVYPGRDTGGWDIWASDPKVEPIWLQYLTAVFPTMTAAAAEKIRADNEAIAGKPVAVPPATPPAMMPAASFPIWPMVAVGVIAVGLFAATLAIKRR